jgi:ferredoxin
MRLRVLPGRCEGHGSCYFVDTEIFPLDDRGQTAVVDGTEIPEDQVELAKEGVLACPVLALEVQE